MALIEENCVSSEFASLLSNTFTISGLEQLFSVAFIFTVETGFIPTSLADHFSSIDSNIQVAKMMNTLSLKSFWQQKSKVFTAELVMSNKLCHLIGFPNGDSLIITLCHSNISKCVLLEKDDIFFNVKPVEFSHISYMYKNTVSVPIKCAILDIVIGRYPNLCGLPEEVILHIMAKLKAPDLYALMRSCRKLYLLANSNQLLWKKLMISEYSRSFTADLYEALKEYEPIDWRQHYFALKNKKGKKRKAYFKSFNFNIDKILQ